MPSADAGTPAVGERALVVGTAGHVDHGKTELVRGLTDVDTDRWEEEKERGLSIDIGFARLPLDAPGAEVGIVDVPGHEDFVKNMLAGATGIDLLLLAVAADEGPMPQTREHLAIARLLGVGRGVVALTRVDRVDDPGWIELVREATRDELRAVGAGEDWPVVPVSPVTGEGMEELRDELSRRARDVPTRPVGDLLRMPVDRVFTLTGTGTVLTGTIWTGSVEVDDRVRLLPDGPETRVRSIEVHGDSRERAGAGRRCGLGVVGVDADRVDRGASLVAGPGWRPTRRLGVRLRLLSHAERAVEEGQRVRVYLGTREAMARVRLADRDALAAGGRAWARLDLEEPLVARAGDRFVLRFYSPVTTIGGGRVAALDAGDAWRDRTEAWAGVLEPDATAGAVRASVRLSGKGGRRPEDLPVETGVPAGEIREEVPAPPDGVVEAGGRWYAEEVVRRAARELGEELDRLHREERRSEAVSLAALRRSVDGGYGDPVVERALERLRERGEIEVSGPAVRRPAHRPSLTGDEERIRRELLEVIEEGGLSPPETEELASRVTGLDGELLHDLLELTVEDGDLVRISPDLHLAPESERELRRAARGVLEEADEPVSPGPFKEALGVSRSYLIPYLEYLDRTGLSRRTGEGRVLVDPEAGPGGG